MRPALPLGMIIGLVGLTTGCNRDPAAPGQSGTRPSLPDASEITCVRIVPQSDPKAGVWPENALSEAGPIGEFVAWLRGIDWSKSPGDIRRMDLPPVSQLILDKRDGTTLVFGLLDTGIIYREGLWSVNTQPLKAIFKKAAGNI